MKLFGLQFSAVWMLCCCLVYGRGHSLCNAGKLLTRINLTTHLQSEILLPCLFEPALFGSHLTTNSAAEWTQINETTDYILEIIVNVQIRFWNSRHNRIEAFRDAAASGNFSILIKDVQLSDLGLYRCQLFRDNCSLGYKEIQISLAAVEFSLLSNWQLIAAGGGGGFLLLCLITVCIYYTRTKRQRVDASVNDRSHNCHDEDVEIVYASVVVKSRNCHDNKVLNNNPINGSASEPVNPEMVLYATVKQRDRR
ncbi:hypothetical protein Q8A67_003952 [Cirrhinus molitorella]|uniref:Immunoglobulin V-set domain-containing protein n=1 Tax=Cirrhinus molitorella TaxID=172907 RepID=A0AA88TUY9_9TELE|nr:hypothetical protein Q8A67_003952 [Cirrhinus molitorella]